MAFREDDSYWYFDPKKPGPEEADYGTIKKLKPVFRIPRMIHRKESCSGCKRQIYGANDAILCSLTSS